MRLRVALLLVGLILVGGCAARREPFTMPFIRHWDQAFEDEEEKKRWAHHRWMMAQPGPWVLVEYTDCRHDHDAAYRRWGCGRMTPIELHASYRACEEAAFHQGWPWVRSMGCNLLSRMDLTFLEVNLAEPQTVRWKHLWGLGRLREGLPDRAEGECVCQR